MYSSMGLNLPGIGGTGSTGGQLDQLRRSLGPPDVTNFSNLLGFKVCVVCWVLS